MTHTALRDFLEEKVLLYNSSGFIEADPISIPHMYSGKEDIEISAFLAATISWGNRKSIVSNSMRMMKLMDDSPFDFVMNHQSNELKKFNGFAHRTFNSEDLTQFIKSLRNIYKKHGGLEIVFTNGFEKEGNAAYAISNFKNVFFEKNKSARTTKHVSDPLQGSTAKRLNMYLRWMVRSNRGGVDFGLWKGISPSNLSIPLDIHTRNISRKLGLLHRSQNDWRAVEELDAVLRSFDAEDPVKYDFALFGLGAIEKF